MRRGRQTHTECMVVLPYPSWPTPSGHGFDVANLAPLSGSPGFLAHFLWDVWVSSDPGCQGHAAGLCRLVLVDESLPSSQGNPRPFHPTHVCVPGQPFPVHNLPSKPGILWLVIEGRPRGIRVTGLGVAKLASLGNAREDKGYKQWP